MISVTADKLPNMHSTDFNGIPLVIQWPKGSVRVGEHDDGTPFKTEMKADYGYIPNTVAVGDEERLDVYIGPNKDAEYVYVIEQADKATGDFDEFKLMLGFDSLEDAEEMYEYHIEGGDKEMADISEVPFDYVFDRVKGEQHEDKAVEEQTDEAEIAHDESKVADEKTTLIDAFVRLYKHEFEYFSRVAEEVNDQLADALQEAGIKAAITFRAKKPRKLKGKLLKRDQTRHYQSFQDIYDDIVDLAGVRVALYLPADRDAVGEIISNLFTVMRDPKNFPEDSGPGDTLGYIATHYLVRLKPESLHKDEYQYADTNVEIQVASVLMHAWAEITHDLIYKPEKGRLTPEETAMIADLNQIVQKGEATLERLQESVQNRTHRDLRFELMSSLAKRLAAQSEGRATRRITASDVEAVAKQAVVDIANDLSQYMKDLGWNYAGFNDWSDPVKPQEQIQVFHDGWIHRAWEKLQGSGNTLQELQEYLGKRGLDDAKHDHKLDNQPPMPHVSYLKAKLALWKAHGR
jgi:ppGpp synthetase/RelA/SpoT-type nucleotidyltranferase